MATRILYEEGDKYGNQPDSVFVQVRQHMGEPGEDWQDTVMEWAVRLDGEIIDRGRKFLEFEGFQIGDAREQRAGIRKFDELVFNHPTLPLPERDERW